jgi:hypothetical protein
MNFIDLYQRIRSIDEAGPAMMDPAAMMQQQMGAMQAKMPNLDPATMMKNQQARLAQMQQKNKAAVGAVNGPGEYKVNGKVVDKATYDAFMAQHPELTQLTPGQLPSMPKMPSMPQLGQQTTSSTTGGGATTRKSSAPAAAPTVDTDDDTDWEESIDNNPEKPVEECGPMGPSGMMGMRDQQPDNVSMNLSMNGQGPGGIRDLLDILKDIGDTSSEPDAGPGDLELAIGSMSHPHDEPEHDEEDGLVFGNDLEGVEPPKHYGGQGVPGAKFDLYMQQRKDQLAGQKPVGEEYGNEPNEMYSTVDDVVNIGSNDGRGDNERPKVNGGGNPYAVTSEGIKRQLQNLYYEVKSR